MLRPLHFFIIFFSLITSLVHAKDVAEVTFGAQNITLTLPLSDYFFDFQISNEENKTGEIKIWNHHDLFFSATLNFLNELPENSSRLCSPDPFGLGGGDDLSASQWLPIVTAPLSCGKVSSQKKNGSPPRLVVKGEMSWSNHNLPRKVMLQFSGAKPLWHLHRATLTEILNSIHRTEGGHKSYIYHNPLGLRITLPNGPLIQVGPEDIKILLQNDLEYHHASFIARLLPPAENFSADLAAQWVLDERRTQATQVQLITTPREQKIGRDLYSVFFTSESDKGTGMLVHKDYVFRHEKQFIHIELTYDKKNGESYAPILQNILSQIIFRKEQK